MLFFAVFFVSFTVSFHQILLVHLSKHLWNIIGFDRAQLNYPNSPTAQTPPPRDWDFFPWQPGLPYNVVFDQILLGISAVRVGSRGTLVSMNFCRDLHKFLVSHMSLPQCCTCQCLIPICFFEIYIYIYKPPPMAPQLPNWRSWGAVALLQSLKRYTAWPRGSMVGEVAAKPCKTSSQPTWQRYANAKVSFGAHLQV